MNRRGTAGFTLIEMIVVLVVLGLALGLVMTRGPVAQPTAGTRCDGKTGGWCAAPGAFACDRGGTRRGGGFWNWRISARWRRSGCMVRRCVADRRPRHQLHPGWRVLGRATCVARGRPPGRHRRGLAHGTCCRTIDCARVGGAAKQQTARISCRPWRLGLGETPIWHQCGAEAYPHPSRHLIMRSGV